MARYEVVLASPLSPADAYARIDGVTGCSSWSPGRAEAAAGGSTIAVSSRSSNPLMRTTDEILFAPSTAGSLITYTSEARLRWPVRVLDPLLRLAYSRIGKRVANGLARVLGAQEVVGPDA